MKTRMLVSALISSAATVDGALRWASAHSVAEILHATLIAAAAVFWARFAMARMHDKTMADIDRRYDEQMADLDRLLRQQREDEACAERYLYAILDSSTASPHR